MDGLEIALASAQLCLLVFVCGILCFMIQFGVHVTVSKKEQNKLCESDHGADGPTAVVIALSTQPSESLEKSSKIAENAPEAAPETPLLLPQDHTRENPLKQITFDAFPLRKHSTWSL